MALHDDLLALYPNVPVETLNILENYCKQEVVLLTNREEYTSDLDTAALMMFQEKYSKLGAEGISRINAAGVTELYTTQYSPNLRRLCVQLRRRNGL